MRQGDNSGALNRRDFVKRGAAGAAGAAAAATATVGVLPAEAAVRRTGGDRAASKLSEAERSRLYLTGLASLTEEVSLERLPVEGEIPRWLTGTLVRNGPAQWEVGKRTFNHWFDGLGMLHGFSFQRGRVSYRNRFLRCDQYESAKEGKIGFNEFGTDPCREIFNGVVTPYHFAPVPNANVTVKQLGDKFIASTEYPQPLLFDPKTLETLGVDERGRGDAQISTAHLHRDPRTGEVLDYQIRVGANSAYIVRSFAGGRWRTIGEVPTGRQFGYIHSFALTERYVVIAECPLLVNPEELALDKRPFIENYVWDPDRGTRFIVVERSTGRNVATLEGEPFFCFHHINAYEQGSRLIVDLTAHEDSSIVDDLYIAKLRGGSERNYRSDFYVRRCTLDLAAKTAKVEKLGPGIELPRINYDRFNTSPYRYAWGVSIRDTRTSGFSDQIGKLDTSSGRLKTWHERGSYPGEPIFVRAPRSRREDGGVLLSVVLDGLRHTSYLLVLDARTLEEIGRARVPHHIPFGFHGEHFS